MSPLDLLLPRTDAGVAVQLVLLLVIAPVAIWAGFRRHRELGVFVTGCAVFALAVMGARAVH